MTTRSDTSFAKPVRVSNLAIYGMPIEKEFTRTSAPIIEVSTIQGQNQKDTYALVDSGCEGYAFIDPEYAKQAGLTLLLVDRPFPLYGFDREDEHSRVVRYYIRCQLKSGTHLDKDAILYTTLLLYYLVILGYL